jgi:hypothetical protein
MDSNPSVKDLQDPDGSQPHIHSQHDINEYKYKSVVFTLLQRSVPLSCKVKCLSVSGVGSANPLD